MVQVLVEDELDVEIGRVWSLVSDFVEVVAIQGLPVRGEGDGVGMRRIIDGSRLGVGEIVEELVELDHAEHVTSYTFVSGKVPVCDHRSTIKLTEAGSRTHIRWSARCEPVGVSDEDAAGLLRGTLSGGIAALQKYFADAS